MKKLIESMRDLIGESSKKNYHLDDQDVDFNVDFKKLEKVKRTWVEIKDEVKATADLDIKLFHFVKDLKASKGGGDATIMLERAHKRFRDASEDLVDAMHEVMKVLDIE